MARQRGRSLRAGAAALALTGCAAIPPGSTPPPAAVLSGLDVLLRGGGRVVTGKRIGLITNHTALDRTGSSAIDLLPRFPRAPRSESDYLLYP